jgi:hypothetical protein
MPNDPELDLRGRLIRGLGALREMFPGSFVERSRAALPTAAAAQLHREFLLSVLWEGKPQTFHLSAGRASARQKCAAEESVGRLPATCAGSFVRRRTRSAWFADSLRPISTKCLASPIW